MAGRGSEILEPDYHILVPDSTTRAHRRNSQAGPHLQQQEAALRLSASPSEGFHSHVSVYLA